MAAILVLTSGTPCAADGLPGITVDPPRPVSFHLADGIRISGDLTSWSIDGCDGSFGGRRWSDVTPADVEKLLQRVVDPEAVDQLVLFGAVLLRLGRDAPSQRAFARAIRVDESARQLVEQAREHVAQLLGEEQRSREAAAAARLSTRSPEARDWPATPWPPLSPAEQEQALLAVRAEADRMVHDAGAALTPIDAQHFLVYSDLDRREAAVHARRLDVTYGRLLAMLGLAADTSLPYGKIAVFIFREHDSFRLIEAQAFDHLPPRTVTAVAHPVGPMVFVNSWKRPDDEAFTAALMHAAIHAAMHRYLTPRRLPAWANDGLADFLVAATIEDSVVDQRYRPLALQYVRGGGNVDAILGQSYRDDWWPGPDEIGPAVGHLLIELMTRANYRGFLAWVNAVKGGKEWEQALNEDYGVPRSGLVRLFVQYYKVND